MDTLIINYLIHKGIEFQRQRAYNVPQDLIDFKKEIRELLKLCYIIRAEIHSVDDNRYMFRVVAGSVSLPTPRFGVLDRGVNSIPVKKIATLLVYTDKDKEQHIIYHSRA